MVEREPRRGHSRAPSPRSFVVVGIATTGRRAVVGAVAPLLQRQVRPPDALLVCIAADEDVDAAALAALPFETIILRGEKGLSRQRNRIVEEIGRRWPAADLLVFLDDDFVPAPTFLAEADRLFEADAGVVVATGHVLADGIKTTGIALESALKRIADDRPDTRTERAALVDVFNGYGCNMALRLAPVFLHGLRFDERLPLYGWLEDVDFSRALAPFGRIVRAGTLRGVHLGSKGGRTSGLRFGYSQVANPIYLVGKKRISAHRAFVRVGRNIVANLVRLHRPEPWVDRRGRLRGNLLALGDLLRGRLAPEKILQLF